MKIQTLVCSLLLFVSSAVTAQIPSDSLVGCWLFNGDASDASIHHNNGIVQGATLVADRFGNANRAYAFDGNDYISIAHDASLNCSDSLSFSVWVKPALLSGTQLLLGKSNYSSMTNYLIRIKPSGYIQWEYNGYSVTDSVPLQLDTWHHLVVTGTESGQIKKIYIDNKLIEVTTGVVGLLGPVTNAFTFGYASYGSEYFRGAMDDVRMYNKVLSESEIDALFNESCNTESTITTSSIDSYTAPDGQVYTSSGVKTAVIPNALGCDSVITINLSITTVDLQENSLSNDLLVYPNPTKGLLSVDLGFTQKQLTAELSDLHGTILKQQTYTNQQGFDISIDGPVGVYMLTVISDNKRVTVKVIKK